MSKYQNYKSDSSSSNDTFETAEEGIYETVEQDTFETAEEDIYETAREYPDNNQTSFGTAKTGYGNKLYPNLQSSEYKDLHDVNLNTSNQINKSSYYEKPKIEQNLLYPNVPKEKPVEIGFEPFQNYKQYNIPPNLPVDERDPNYRPPSYNPAFVSPVSPSTNNKPSERIEPSAPPMEDLYGFSNHQKVNSTPNKPSERIKPSDPFIKDVFKSFDNMFSDLTTSNNTPKPITKPFPPTTSNFSKRNDPFKKYNTDFTKTAFTKDSHNKSTNKNKNAKFDVSASIKPLNTNTNNYSNNDELFRDGIFDRLERKGFKMTNYYQDRFFLFEGVEEYKFLCVGFFHGFLDFRNENITFQIIIDRKPQNLSFNVKDCFERADNSYNVMNFKIQTIYGEKVVEVRFITHLYPVPIHETIDYNCHGCFS
ncbi:hypothetical protein A0H76_2292 [Hepatospora eriocheir]|uniref:Uncharacterized protein n=1 Tax=Hepatospora eriocheir TaxID=1081669 RepID=A0A1X0QFL5_9MICR|nr:hypothetical protein A0H76_2292 [Hepatospora eriocheir]